ncbi:MAG: hypothetical protein KBD12_02310 [Candidatus Pacebacteria bacterium]|nr:hypothetical protein [Candidatus Paceibacterota bacterium]
MLFTSTLLAQILSLPFLVIGLSMFFDKKNNIKAIDEITKDPGQLWIAGFLFLMTGTLILAFTNLYGGLLNIFLSILGILSFVKGTIMIIIPHKLGKVYRSVIESEYTIFLIGIMCILISVFMFMKGF